MTRMKIRFGAAVTVLAMLACGVGAQAQGPVAPATAVPAPFAGTGAYPAMSEPAPGLATHTLYRPRDLAAVKGRLPVIAWANGGCRNENTAFRTFLTEIASHGYLIVAIGPYSDGPAHVMVEPVANPRPNKAVPEAQPAPQPTRASQLIDAIDWAQAENARPGSPLEGRLDLARVAVMGQSCGGFQALDVAGDRRIATMILWDSGLFPDGASSISPAKAQLRKVHFPIAYFIGGPTDLAYANANDDFARIQGVPVFLGNIALGHTGDYALPEGGPFAPVGIAWLDWRLKGDPKAKAVFAGPDCGLCRDPAWTVQRKDME